MSWDIFGMHLPDGIKTAKDIPAGFKPTAIGSRSEIIARIKALYPEANFSDPSWGQLFLPDCIIEFPMGDEEVLESLAMYVRGDGGDVVARILAHFGLRAFDTASESGLFEMDPVRRAQTSKRGGSYLSAVAEHLGNEDKSQDNDP